jgi:serine/threonine protein kinase
MSYKYGSQYIGNYRFKQTDLLGKGTYGRVYKGIDVSTLAPVAIKQINYDGDKKGIDGYTMREISSLRELAGHEKIVSLLQVIRTSDVGDNFHYLVFEYCPFTLDKFYDESHFKQLTKQLCNGMAYLHINGILHRDLKPQNILISYKNVLKIADFGMSRRVSVPSRRLSHEVVTL